MAWWVDFEHLGPQADMEALGIQPWNPNTMPQEHWTPDQASVAARTMPSGRPMSGTACPSLDPLVYSAGSFYLQKGRVQARVHHPSQWSGGLLRWQGQIPES